MICLPLLQQQELTNLPYHLKLPIDSILLYLCI